MSEIKRKGQEAERMLRDDTFVDVMDTIRKNAVGVFSNAKSDIDSIAKAHEAIRAVETILDEFDARIVAAQIEEKRKGSAP